MKKTHRHLIVRARVSNPPTEHEYVEQWMKNIVSSVGMNILAGPMTSYSDIPGNEGLTSIVTLDFSHAALHVWPLELQPLVEFDLFSCKDFDVNVVIDQLRKFDITHIGMHYLNRDSNYTGEFGKFEKLYVVYKTTNRLNGHYYYGVHGFVNIADGYLGSGKKLANAIKKYGKSNFYCEHLRYFTTEEQAYQYENSLVTESVVSDSNTYNLAIGGRGCNRPGGIITKNYRKPSIDRQWITNGTDSKIVYITEEIPSGWYKGRVLSQQTKQKLSEIRKGRPSHKKGKPMPVEQRLKIQNTLQQRYKILPHHSKGKKYKHVDQ